MKDQNIHNLDTLQKELDRLGQNAGKMEEELSDNLEFLRHNFFTLGMNSFNQEGNRKAKGRETLFHTLFQNEAWRNAAENMRENIAEKAAEGMEKLINKILHKQK